MKFFLYILLAIIILLVMVVIHEFGHYLAGKILKFKINEFSVGFGPKLLSKKRKNGEVFSLRLVPLGGYCAFEGEASSGEETNIEFKKTDPEKKSDVKINASSSNSRAFQDEKPWKRIIVFAAGGVFNLISAILFSFIFILIVGSAMPKVSKVYFSDMENNTPYNQLMEGDEIVALNGKKITIMKSFEDLRKDLKQNESVVLTISRQDTLMDITIKYQEVTVEGETYVGFGFQSMSVYQKGNFLDAAKYCVPFTGKMALTILGSFFELITGKMPITNLTGPIGTIGTIATVSAANWRNILLLFPLIAANLGIFNLLPIPALDGSKIVFGVIEWIRRKPMNPKIENTIHMVGLMVLFAFVIIVDVVGILLR